MTGPDPGTLRLFMAIPLPECAKQTLEKIQKHLRSRGVQAAWTRPETHHLTLKFLGNVSCQALLSLEAPMVQTAEAFAPFELSVGGLGVFPGVRQARVVWAGTGGQTDILEALFQHLENCLQALGIQKEGHRFSAHITLGRIKKPVPAPEWIELFQWGKDLRSPSFGVNGFDLFKSELNPSGAVHTSLFQVKFKPKER